MQITFDTTTITDDEVRGIFALLDTVRPAFDAAEFTRALGAPDEEVTRAVKDAFENLRAAQTDTDQDIASITMDNRTELYMASTTDSTGLVWDERIHASSKALNADGTWRTKRGVDKALVASVEAGLRGGARVNESDPVEPAQTVAPPAPEAPTYAPEAAKVETVAPPAPPAPKPPTSVALEQGSAVSPFVALMKRVTTAQGAGKLTAQRVKELLESLDKKSIMDLRTDTDALDAFAVLLDGEGV